MAGAGVAPHDFVLAAAGVMPGAPQAAVVAPLVTAFVSDAMAHPARFGSPMWAAAPVGCATAVPFMTGMSPDSTPWQLSTASPRHR